MTDKRFACSINKKLINKHVKGDPKWFSDGFVERDLTAIQLRDEVLKGHAFSYVFSGSRKTANFVQTGILAVDVDGARLLDEALDDPFVRQNALFVYTTASHTLHEHRYRIVFGLEDPLTEVEDVTNVSLALAAQLAGDFSTVDGARIFFGSTGGQHTDFGNTLNPELVEQLRIRGVDLNNQRKATQRGARSASSISAADTLKPSQEVVLRSGKSIAIEDITRNTSVYCPHHHDTSPSAFVDISPRTGSHFLHCRVCHLTWWTSKRSKRFNFNAFEDLVVELSENTELRTREVDTPFGKVTDPFPGIRRIVVKDEAKLEGMKLPAGLTFIKSPKGTGKTTALPVMFDPFIRHQRDECINLLDWLEENEDLDGPPIDESFETHFSILLIGHRQALIREMCQRLNLHCYLDDEKPKGFEQSSRTPKPYHRRYGICLDSIIKVPNKPYDLIIIDESEQVLSHFFADTMRDRREGHFPHFHSLLRASSRVICLDADLGWITFDTITRLAGATSMVETKEGRALIKEATGTVPKKPKKGYSRAVSIIINRHVDANRPLTIYSSRNTLHGELIDAVRAKKKVFVASNSKRTVDRLGHMLSDQAPNAKVFVITSDNSRSDSVQAFIQNIKTEVLNYDAVLCSPSLGTGIDITFPEDTQEIDVVFGFFEAGVNSHLEIDQQLARVRHPKDVRVWISPRPAYFETELGVVEDEILRSRLIANTYLGFDPDTLEDSYRRDEAMVRLAALVLSRNHASQNALKKNFIEHKEKQGYVITYIEEDEDLADLGRDGYREGKKLAIEVAVQKVMNAPAISKTTFDVIRDSIRNSQSVDSRLLMSYRRHRLELFYRQQVSDELVRLDDDGRFKGRVLNFEQTMDAIRAIFGDAPDEPKYLAYRALNESLDKNDTKAFTMRSPFVAAVMTARLLDKAGLITSTGIDFEKELSLKDLEQLVRYARKQRIKRIVEVQVIPVRADIGSKPTRFLGELLRNLGLTLKQVRNEQKGGTKTYFYRVVDNAAIPLLEIARRRNRTHPKSYHAAYWDDVHRSLGGGLPIPNDGTDDSNPNRFSYEYDEE